MVEVIERLRSALADRYRVQRELGRGGMATVYLADDLKHRRKVAIKVLDPDLGASVGSGRFLREVETAARLTHPHILPLHDSGSAGDLLYYVMPYIEGESLRDRLRRERELPVEEALRIAREVADALGYAHGQGVLHRDIKPKNILLSGGHALVADFGIARAIGVSATGVTETQRGFTAGTPLYMSPEQASGETGLDGRSDIYGLGCVFYEMLTGQPPFVGPTTEGILQQHLTASPRPVRSLRPSVPESVAVAVERALAKRPADRFATAREFAAALAPPGGDVRGTGAPSTQRPGRARAPLAVAAGVAILALGIWLNVGHVRDLVRSHPQRAIPPVRITPLTSYPGDEYFPAISPDGKQVAFTWSGNDGLNFDIYVKLIDMSPPLRLTTDPAVDYSPAWSPDGRQIAFVRESARDGGVFLVPALGGPERRVGHVYPFRGGWLHRLDWSPDGRYLALADAESAEGVFRVYLVSVHSGERHQVTNPDPRSTGDFAVAFSPSGRSLAFIRGTGNSCEICVVSPEGGEPSRLAVYESGTISNPGLCWTADGASVVFWGSREGRTGLWKVRAAGGSPEAFPVGGEGATDPSMSRDGRRLAYSESPFDTDVWSLSLPGGKGPASPQARKLIASSRIDGWAQFSPDGAKIAFQSNRSGNDEIWVCDPDGSNARSITTAGASGAVMPSWSPNGRELAYWSDGGGHPGIHAVSADGGSERLLTPESSVRADPSWSRDGGHVYFASRRSGTQQVWMAPSGGGAAVQVTKLGGAEPLPSRDGRFLYYSRLEGEFVAICRTPTTGGREDRILEFPQGSAWDIGRRWAVTETGIYFINFHGGTQNPNLELDFFEFVKSRISRVTAVNCDASTMGVQGLAVSPDRHHVMFTVERASGSDILLAEGFR